jgi:hypothetical protein
MKKYDWKNEYNPIRRTAKRLLSGEPLSDGRPLSELIERGVFEQPVQESNRTYTKPFQADTGRQAQAFG